MMFVKNAFSILVLATFEKTMIYINAIMDILSPDFRDILAAIYDHLPQRDLVVMSRVCTITNNIHKNIKIRCDSKNPGRLQKIQECAACNHIICLQKYKLTTIEDFDQGLRSACEGGHLELANLMIKHGANDFDRGLRGACEKGHLKLVNLMIKHGANDFNRGLYDACEGGHLELANLMIKHGANDFSGGLYYACEGGHLELVNLMIKHGATTCDNCNTSAAECRTIKTREVK
jgi:hypothetical protein